MARETREIHEKKKRVHVWAITLITQMNARRQYEYC
ncbi:MAG: hypothetical protein QG657_2725 [Acidobacteriota bacterium]|nr:hypothetical protein [Acidobacteriota bacterium]